MRARHPDVAGVVEVDGVGLGYEVFGDGDPTLLLMPTWMIVHSRFWKAQVPYLARRHRVVTYDGPGNGRSDRPLDPAAYTLDAAVDQAVAVLDATGTERAVVVSMSQAVSWSLSLAADHPDRVLGQVIIAPSLRLTPQAPESAKVRDTFLDRVDRPQGWEKFNAHYWRSDYPDFVDFFFTECLPEPHSTKPHEDAVGWAMETTPEILIIEAMAGKTLANRDAILEACGRISSPTLVIHGDDDRVSPVSRGETLAEVTGGEFVRIEGGGHLPMTRHPVAVNLHIERFVDHIEVTA
jgi:pimeloyl-ACP methyl ester carboxylesterase